MRSALHHPRHNRTGPAGTTPKLPLAVDLNPFEVVLRTKVAKILPSALDSAAPSAEVAVQVIGQVAHPATDGPPENPVEIANSVILPDLVPGAMVFMSLALAIRVWRRSFSEIRLIHLSNTLASTSRSMMIFLSRLQALESQTPLQLSRIPR
jgi:hypothetical protein